MADESSTNFAPGDDGAASASCGPVARVRRRINPRLLGKGWRRRTRWVWRVVLGVPLLLVVLGLLLMRSPLVAYLARGAIEPLLGCKMQAGSVAISLDGRLIIEELSLRVPSMSEPASEFLFVKRAEADLDWSGLLRGEVNPTGLRLNQPLFRVSQSTTTGGISIADLRPVPQKKQRLTQPPKIDVLDGVVEFGEHAGGNAGADVGRTYRSLSRLNVSGNLTPSDPLRPIYIVRLQERVQVDGGASGTTPQYEAGMIVDGKIDLDGSAANVRVMNIGLNPWPSGSVPTYMRDVWNRLNIRGKVSEVSLTYDPTNGPEATVTVDHVSMDALVPAEAHSGKQDDMLSLESVVGTIKVSTKQVKAELDATVEGQSAPAHVSLVYDGITEESPFRCVIRTNQFRIDKNPGWLVFTPIEVKENLAAFCGPTGMLSGEVVIERGEPTKTESGEVAGEMKVAGKLDLSEGTAAFHRVPYPFKNMTGHVEFDQDKITITRITGSADSGATIEATGWIAPPDETAEISLHVVVKRIPLDRTFAESLPVSRQGAMSFLFNPERYAAMRRAGLIADEGSKQAAARMLGEYQREWDRLAAVCIETDREFENLRERIEETERVLGAPNFELGGVSDLDIQVHSPRGKESPWAYTVMVSIPKAGFVLRGFPLPIVAKDTKLRITQDTATLLAGTFEGLSGGRFNVEAGVVLERGGEAVVWPTVRASARDVPVDEMLVFALSHARGGSGVESEAVAETAPPVGSESTADQASSRFDLLLKQLRAEGRVSCDASIVTSDEGELTAAGSVSMAGVEIGPILLGDGSRLYASGVDAALRLEGSRVVVPWVSGDLRRHVMGGTMPQPVMEWQDAGAFRFLGEVELARSPGDSIGFGRKAENQAAVAGNLPDATTARTSGSVSSLFRQASGTMTLSDVDASLDLSSVVRVFSASAADSIESAIGPRKPTGRVDAELHAAIEPGAGDAASMAIDARLVATRGLGIDWMGERVGVDLVNGSVGLKASVPLDVGVENVEAPVVVLDDCRAIVSTIGGDRLVVSADGMMGLDMGSLRGADGRSGSAKAASSARRAPMSSGLRVSLGDAKFESCIVREIVARQLDPQTAAKINSFDPRGVFDAELVLDGGVLAAMSSRNETGRSNAGGDSVVGRVWPRSLSLVQDGRGARLEAAGALGVIEFDANGVRTGGLALVGADWNAAMQFDVGLGGSGGDVHVAAVASAASLSPDLAAWLPETARTRLDESKVVIAGPISLEPMLYSSRSSGVSEHVGTSERISGVLRFNQLSLDAAMSVRDASGECDFALWRDGSEDWRYDARLASPRLTLAGLDLRSVNGRVVTGATPETILIQAVSAECYTGRITGSGAIEPALVIREDDRLGGDKGMEQRRAYRGEVSLAGVQFAPILDAVGASETLDGSKGGGAGGAAHVQVSPGSRGAVDAAVTFTGVFGLPETRSGLGSVRISGGDIVRMPVVMTLLQLSNFQLPARDTFDYMQSSFRLAGENVTFDQIALISRTLAITGYGAMTWPGQELDLRFNSRSAGRVPLVSDVVEALRNEVATTRITGTLMKPTIDPEPLLGTRQLINSALGQPGGPKRSISEQQADEAARAERERLKGASSRVPTESDRP